MSLLDVLTGQVDYNPPIQMNSTSSYEYYATFGGLLIMLGYIIVLESKRVYEYVL